jgi:hypothetical protein
LDKPLDKLHRSQFENLSERELTTLNRLLFRARRPQAN